jgi:hypothetical protein
MNWIEHARNVPIVILFQRPSKYKNNIKQLYYFIYLIPNMFRPYQGHYQEKCTLLLKVYRNVISYDTTNQSHI